jgi:hypothetical protein
MKKLTIIQAVVVYTREIKNAKIRATSFQEMKKNYFF